MPAKKGSPGSSICRTWPGATDGESKNRVFVSRSTLCPRGKAGQTGVAALRLEGSGDPCRAVGMTGGGSRLCVGLLEEAAIDGIPAIVIDPKGISPTCS